jgi:ATP-dependent Lon protease
MAKKNTLLENIINSDKNVVELPKSLTILPLRDIIIFPNMIFPILIGRPSTLKAVADTVDKEKFIFVTAQKSNTTDDPKFEDIYEYGTIAKIIQVLRLPNNLLKVLVEGFAHGKIIKKSKRKDCLEAEIEVIHPVVEKSKEFSALTRHTRDLFSKYVKKSANLPGDLIGAYLNIEDPVRRLYFAAANVNASIEKKQQILEATTLQDQYFRLSSLLRAEIELIGLEDEIDLRINDTIQKTQRKYYIQEQIRALQKELGDDDESMPEIALLREAIDKANMPEHALAKANEELDKLKKTPTISPEFSVNRTYIELLTQMPWSVKSQDNLNIKHVETVLNEDHYDLEKPKDRILEFISILNLAGQLKRQILCLVGPPGVGKTSLARSIARALGRKFVRISLGGVRDEAEIRGHRRTYIGALPGKIVSSMKKAETINPVILLDEIDKLANDFRGDPASALLEVLDPEQNVNFNDHYLEVDYDLSNVMFITTANVRYDIPGPLLDRMEVIELSSYLDPDKLEIAKRHILPKLKIEYGFENIKVHFEDEALMRIITEYTREAGVRNLERSIATIFRKLAKDIVADYDSKLASSTSGELVVREALIKDTKFKKYVAKKEYSINSQKIDEYLKTPKYKVKKEDLEDKIGVAMGLAWTAVGGDILPIEVTFMPSSSEKLTLTGKLGDVMKESAVASLSYIRANLKEFGIPESFNKKKEIHIHVPEGAIPKDGPSAGITMTLALISAAKGVALRGDLAMTGEITLRGKVLPIGGLNEKLLAAKKAGAKTVLIPQENAIDLQDVSDVIKQNLEIIPVKHISEAIPHAFRNWKKSK